MQHTHTTHTLRHLADLADVADPDSRTSAGADWLDTIQNDVNELDLDDVTYPSDAALDIASARSGEYGGFNTDYEMWLTFVDLNLGARNLDESVTIEHPSHLAWIMLHDAAARLALALIDERLRLAEKDDR